MALQTTVIPYLVAGYPGQVVAINNATTVDSFAVASADGTINWGDGVFYGSAAGTITVGVTGSTLAQFAGFVVRQAFNENAAGSGYIIAQGEIQGVLQIGQIYVTPSSVMALTDTPYLITESTDANYPVGSLANSAAPTVGVTASLSLITKVRILTPATVAGQAIRIQLLSN